MSQETIIDNTEVSFKDFLFKNKSNRTILWLAAAAIVLQFAIFKYFYPFASYIHGDSFSYINAAYQNLSINTYLIGYSKFLRLFSVFSKSDAILTAFQYLFIQTNVLFLIFTVYFFYRPTRIARYILLCLMIFNPLFLYLGNMISSDGLFLGLSTTWITLLLWIIHQPSKKIIIWHAIVLLISLSIRYNAIIYPFISIIAFCLSKLTLRQKITGLSLGIVLCAVFVTFTMYQYKKLTGIFQYSPFSGWQFANNAMYAYRYVDSAERKPVPNKFETLDKMIRQYFDTTRDTNKYPLEKIKASTYYMWSPGLPLVKYRDSIFKLHDTAAKEFKKWASVGPLLKEYGLTIIKQYPLQFARHFLWPNALKYYAPPIEFLENYNSGKDYVNRQTMLWFGYKNQKVATRFKDKNVTILNYYPMLSGVVNVLMVCCLICYLILKGWKFIPLFSNAIIISGTIWFLNALFTICASSAALRFQSFPIIITTIFTILLIDWLVQLLKHFRHEEMNSSQQNKLYKQSSNNIAVQ